MNPTMLASRAVIAEYAKRVVRPIIIAGVILLVVGLLGSAYLVANVSAWWTILMVIVVAYGVLGSIAWLIVRFTLGRIRPAQDAGQRKAVTGFVDRIESIQDTMGMTRFGLLLRIVRDVTQRRTDNTITKFVGDSKGLQKDFSRVIKAFSV